MKENFLLVITGLALLTSCCDCKKKPEAPKIDGVVTIDGHKFHKVVVGISGRYIYQYIDTGCEKCREQRRQDLDMVLDAKYD